MDGWRHNTWAQAKIKWWASPRSDQNISGWWYVIQHEPYDGSYWVAEYIRGNSFEAPVSGPFETLEGAQAALLLMI